MLSTQKITCSAYNCNKSLSLINFMFFQSRLKTGLIKVFFVNEA
jgi:hypothetical protein